MVERVYAAPSLPVMLTNIKSPTRTVSSPEGRRNFSIGTTPSSFRPMSTMIESAVIDTTFPSMAWPFPGPWCCCSNSERMAAKELSVDAALASSREGDMASGAAGDVRFCMEKRVFELFCHSPGIRWQRGVRWRFLARGPRAGHRLARSVWSLGRFWPRSEPLHRYVPPRARSVPGSGIEAPAGIRPGRDLLVQREAYPVLPADRTKRRNRQQLLLGALPSRDFRRHPTRPGGHRGHQLDRLRRVSFLLASADERPIHPSRPGA